MNPIKKILSGLLIACAGYGLFAACGTGGGTCLVDGDCLDGEACEAEACTTICADDTECLDGEVCRVGDNTMQKVCKAAAGNNGNNGNNGGTNNGGTNNGGTNNGNNGGGTLLYMVQVWDASSGDAACAGSDPGSDIMGVELEDITGSKLGFGSIVADNIIADGNDFSSTAHILGDPVDFGGDTCPDFDAATVAALGCGGDIAVEFVDSDGNAVALDSSAGQQIRVYEFGSQCPTGSDADSYDVNICDDTAGVRNGDTASCTINVGLGAEGEQTFDVSGF